MAVTETPAEWSRGQRWEAIPVPARRKAIDVVYGSTGAMIACSWLPEIHRMGEHLHEQQRYR